VTLSLPLPPFTADDADRLADAWGFSCGPAALCVMTQLEPETLRPHLAPYRGFMNPSEMRAALRSVGAPHRVQPLRVGTRGGWPDYGLVRVQWSGPWLAQDKPPTLRYHYTHWVGCMRDPTRGMCIFDINAIDMGGWLLLDAWQTSMVPALLEHIARADGFYNTHAFFLREGQ